MLMDDNKVISYSHAKYWLMLHEDDEVRRFLDFYFDKNVIEYEFLNLLQDPISSYNLIKQFFLSNDDKYRMVLNRLSGNSSYICIVVGGRGSGKTCHVSGIVEQLLRRGCKVAYVGMPQSVPYFLNDYHEIKKVGGKVAFFFDFFSVPQDYIIVQDESAVIENAKNFNDKLQKEREDILPILRHKGNSVIYISQQFSFLSKRIRDFADCFIIKPYNLMALLKENSGVEFPFPQVVKNFIPKQQDEALFVDSMLGIFTYKHDAPGWYIKESDKYGKAFKNIECEDEAQGFIKALINNDYPPDRIRHFLRLRGYDKPLSYYKSLVSDKD